MSVRMNWLPQHDHWDVQLSSLKEERDVEQQWRLLGSLASSDIDFTQTLKLDRAAQRLAQAGLPNGLQPVRLALLGSSTLKHLLPGIRVAGLRRRLWIEIYEGEYGQYMQELLHPDSGLHAFRPEFVCFALDAQHICDLAGCDEEKTFDILRNCWNAARNSFSCTLIQQTALPVFPAVMGSNEHRYALSLRNFLRRFNTGIEKTADQEGVHLLAIDQFVAEDGLSAWFDRTLWYRAKQEVSPAMAPLYGDFLVRILAAQRGLSAKCLVLDLDNTLWGGVIGDDGLQGIVLGQGSAAGEAYVAFQKYAKQLSERGIILAICSKNDEANALDVFEQHAEMVLRRSDIACFRANWQDKATNLREIASALNVGLDTLVFVDDNPFERNLVRQELPEVLVPEMPEDPALYAETLARAGYFEGLTLTKEDSERSTFYKDNFARETLRQSVTDMDGYLKNLEMKLIAQPFHTTDVPRVVQLINKTNQFNLMTRRYATAEVQALVGNPKVWTLQARLLDRFGDNGIIAVLIGRLCDQENNGASVCPSTKNYFVIDTWLMSCRVLGRQVEEECLNLLIEEAKQLGAKKVIGEYSPTVKNKMVSDLYERLGFSLLNAKQDGATKWELDVYSYVPKSTYIETGKVKHAGS